jgi:hypothetical protein
MNDSYSSPPSGTQAWDALTRLALDVSWSWSHSAGEIWKRVDPELWELTTINVTTKAQGSWARGSEGCCVSPAHRRNVQRIGRSVASGIRPRRGGPELERVSGNR